LFLIEGINLVFKSIIFDYLCLLKIIPIMRNKNILLIAFFLVLTLASCGPAAENRDAMVRNSQRVADSIANLIRTSLQEAEMPPMNVIKVDTAPAANTATEINIGPR
jgi:hypothetical protein